MLKFQMPRLGRRRLQLIGPPTGLGPISILPLLFWLFIAAISASAQEANIQISVKIDRNIPVAVRDGVNLNGVLYRPADMSGQLPTILAMTPYMADSLHDKGMYFARHGYAFIVIDQRGRGNSEGRFVPWEADGRDGYDAIAWIARQPWSDGKVGMMGGSYSGRNQWAMAKAFPPILKTIVPTASNFIGFDFPGHLGVHDAWLINWYSGVYGRTTDKNYRDDYAQFTDVLRANYLAGGSFASIGDLVGMPSPVYDVWFSHPDLDDYWKSLSPTAEEFSRLDIPVLTITGQYDGVQMGALEYYKRHMAAGGPAAARHYVVIGPWNHSGTRTPKANVGGLTVGSAALIDIDRLHLDWFDWTLKNGPKPPFLADRIVYYATGSETWRTAPKLAAVRGKDEVFYPSGPGDGDLIATSGALGTVPPKARTSQITYDPKDRSYGSSEPSYPDAYLRNAYPVTHLNRSGLVYETAPFTAPRILAGQPRLSLALTVDVPDTDLEATLYEIDAAGTLLQLSHDMIRLRYRLSWEHPEPMPSGKKVIVDLPNFTFVAREIPTGSRLLLLIRSVDSIYAQKNYNAGGDVSRETIADARVAHIQVAEGGRDGSHLDLPFVH